MILDGCRTGREAAELAAQAAEEGVGRKGPTRSVGRRLSDRLASFAIHACRSPSLLRPSTIACLPALPWLKALLREMARALPDLYWCRLTARADRIPSAAAVFSPGP